MERKTNISRYSVDEIERLRREGGDKSDWSHADARTREEIEAAAASDEAEDGMTVDWANAQIGLPEPKAVLHMRVDRDVLDFFRSGGRGYQSKINAVLRAYKDAQQPK